MRRLIAMIAGSIALLVVGITVAQPAHAEYKGARWKDGTRAICVTTGNVDNARVLEVLRESVRHLRSRTVLRIPMRKNCWRSGFRQRVNVVDGWYGRGKWAGMTYYPRFTWEAVPTDGPWTNRGWTYTYTGMVKIKVNLSYVARYSKHDKRHVVYHELGHAMGLGHMPDWRRSVMASYRWSRAQWWDITGTNQRPGINRIYARG